MSQELANDVPRLCHLRKWADFDGYGFNLHGAKGKEGQNVGSIDAKSPAAVGGLKVGDIIVEVNAVNVLAENHKSVVDKIKSRPGEVQLLVISSAGWAYYTSKNVHLTGDLDFIQTFETPLTNPYSSYYSKGAKKNQPKSLRRCKLHKRTADAGYGFNLQTLENKPGKYVGQIDPNSPSHNGGLKEGDRIIMVNGASIADLGHKEVVDMIRHDSSGVTLLVVDQKTDDYYKARGTVLGSADWKESDVNVVECSNAASANATATAESSAMGENVEEVHDDLETRFDDDVDDPININNNNNIDVKNNKIENHSTNGNTTNYSTNNDNIESNSTNNNNNNPTSTLSSSSPPYVSSSSSLLLSSSAAEARKRMPKKMREVGGNLTLQDKHKILQGL